MTGRLLGTHSGSDSRTVVCTGPPVPLTGLQSPCPAKAWWCGNYGCSGLIKLSDLTSALAGPSI